MSGWQSQRLDGTERRGMMTGRRCDSSSRLPDRGDIVTEVIQNLRRKSLRTLVCYYYKHFLLHRVRVNTSYSTWAEVTSGIPQGSVLGPLLFLIYLFADDAKLFRHILYSGDHQNLQIAVDQVVEWTQRWLLKLNTKKCLAAVSYTHLTLPTILRV